MVYVKKFFRVCTSPSLCVCLLVFLITGNFIQPFFYCYDDILLPHLRAIIVITAMIVICRAPPVAFFLPQLLHVELFYFV